MVSKNAPGLTSRAILPVLGPFSHHMCQQRAKKRCGAKVPRQNLGEGRHKAISLEGTLFQKSIYVSADAAKTDYTFNTLSWCEVPKVREIALLNPRRL